MFHWIRNRRMLSRLLGIFTLCVATAPVVGGKAQLINQEGKAFVGEPVLRKEIRATLAKRRDPFKPIIRRRSISAAPKKSRPTPKPGPLVVEVKDPQWKLLGVVHGRYGRQAVIQDVSGKRIFVRPGLEPLQSGWIIKTIRRGEILLESRQKSLPGSGVKKPKSFVLSFPSLSESR